MERTVFNLKIVPLLLMILLISCSKDKNATADIYYFSTLDSITWDIQTDVTYTDKVYHALQQIGVVNTTFNIQAEAETNAVADAVWLCDEKAMQTYSSTLEKVQITDIRTNTGIPTLSPFTVHISLHTTYSQFGTSDTLKLYHYKID
ncbi:MAG: hypothetical protein IJT97_08915 [Bacteroidaceae bacterium]|nr:hypothetical protein [Bacteroidaceae bacterium]